MKSNYNLCISAHTRPHGGVLVSGARRKAFKRLPQPANVRRIDCQFGVGEQFAIPLEIAPER